MTLETVINKLRYRKLKTEAAMQKLLYNFINTTQVPIKEVVIDIHNGTKDAPVKADDCSLTVKIKLYPIIDND